MEQNIISLWESLSVDILHFVLGIAASAAIIIIGFVLSRGIQKLIKRTVSASLHVDRTVISLLRAIVRYGIFIICVIMILNVFGVNTTSLLALLGAAGLAIGLALKDTLGNIASGIIIIILGNYRIGEFVEFGSFSGTVREINLFTTILETSDGIHVSAPNSSIWGSPLKNYTRNQKRRMELSISIAYSDSVDLAFNVMQDIIASEPRFLKDPAPQVVLQAIEGNSVKISIRAWASTGDYWNTYWDMTRTIKEKAEAAGLQIPLPQREVRLVQGP